MLAGENVDTDGAVHVCRQPKTIGNCQDYVQRFYYDVEDAECRAFLYGGCGANDNNFPTMDDCQSRCSSSSLSSPSSPPPPLPDGAAPVPTPEPEFDSRHCMLPKAEGSCRHKDELTLHWFYDRQDGVCKQFFYTGCDGNANRFATRQECEGRCSQSQGFHEFFYSNFLFKRFTTR